MALHQNPHQTLTRFGCVRFSIYAWGFSVPQMWQFFLFTYPPRSKWAFSKKLMFLPKSTSSVSRSVAIFPSVVKGYTQPYSFGGRIKLIICQIRHELSVTIHEISTSWKKTLDGEPYIFGSCIKQIVLRRVLCTGFWKEHINYGVHTKSKCVFKTIAFNGVAILIKSFLILEICSAIKFFMLTLLFKFIKCLTISFKNVVGLSIALIQGNRFSCFTNYQHLSSFICLNFLVLVLFY